MAAIFNDLRILYAPSIHIPINSDERDVKEVYREGTRIHEEGPTMIDKNEWLLFSVLTLSIIVIAWASYTFDKYATVQEKCVQSCSHLFISGPDWTCVESCLRINGGQP